MPRVMGPTVSAVEQDVSSCRRCPRLVVCRERAAVTKPRRFASDSYWARGVPGFGDPKARILIVGLAPGAHGANRTGRPFTGDTSGDRLYSALHNAELASIPESTGPGDGQALTGCYITNLVKCVPPGNRPEADEVNACRPFLEQELDTLGDLRVVVALGEKAWRGLARIFDIRPRPAFDPDNATEWSVLSGRLMLLQSWHPSPLSWIQENRGDAEKLDTVLARAKVSAQK